MRVRIALAVGLCLAALAPYGPVQADGGLNASATGTPGPSSDGTGAVTHGRLVAGAGGTYLPITPNDLVPTGPDARSPLDIPPAAPNPQGMTCPAVHVLHLGPGSPGPVGSILEFVAIHPHFTKNSAGGYDGSDSAFGYDVPDAVPAGGDPTATAPGSPATAANIAGHIVSVAAYLHVRGTWVDARQVPPYGGSCQGAQFTFGAPFLEGDAPAPAPPQSVLQTPPFPTGPALVARLSRFVDDRHRRDAARIVTDVSNLRAHPNLRLDPVDGSGGAGAVPRPHRDARGRIRRLSALRRRRHAGTGDVELG